MLEDGIIKTSVMRFNKTAISPDYFLRCTAVILTVETPCFVYGDWVPLYVFFPLSPLHISIKMEDERLAIFHPYKQYYNHIKP